MRVKANLSTCRQSGLSDSPEFFPIIVMHTVALTCISCQSQAKKKEAEASFPLSQHVTGGLRSAGGAVNGTPIGNTERVTFASLKAHVAGIKITFHRRFNG
jgi:hypothetical protein